jgi:hypothetical protein
MNAQFLNAIPNARCIVPGRIEDAVGSSMGACLTGDTPARSDMA